MTEKEVCPDTAVGATPENNGSYQCNDRPTVARQLHNRAVSSYRLPGGDPWIRGLHDGDRNPTTAQLTAWASAANTLVADSLSPILPIEILRLLWRRGGADRELAERLYSQAAA
jgi:hypothetical protein